MESLELYKNSLPLNPMRRLLSFLLNFLIMSILGTILISITTSILSKSDGYVRKEQAVSNAVDSCYDIEKEARIYKFDDSNNPVEMEEMFKEYLMAHIALSYSIDNTIFSSYNEELSEEELSTKASYETDRLAYFYVNYAASHDVVDFEGMDPKAYYYKRFKESSTSLDMWVLDETTFEINYLKPSYALDLYLYLKDDSYQAGLKTYNHLATMYQALFNVEVDALTNSSEFKAHYEVYKENYKSLSMMVDLMILLSYVITFALLIILPSILFKESMTFPHRLLGIKVIDRERYPTTRKNRIIRNIVLFFSLPGSMLIPSVMCGGFSSGITYPIFEISGVGISLLSILIIVIVVDFVSLLICFINKEKRSIHDFLSSTILIDDRTHMELSEHYRMVREEGERQKEKEEKYFDSSSFENTERTTTDIKD